MAAIEIAHTIFAAMVYREKSTVGIDRVYAGDGTHPVGGAMRGGAVGVEHLGGVARFVAAAVVFAGVVRLEQIDIGLDEGGDIRLVDTCIDTVLLTTGAAPGSNGALLLDHAINKETGATRIAVATRLNVGFVVDKVGADGHLIGGGGGGT